VLYFTIIMYIEYLFYIHSRHLGFTMWKHGAFKLERLYWCARNTNTGLVIFVKKNTLMYYLPTLYCNKKRNSLVTFDIFYLMVWRTDTLGVLDFSMHVMLHGLLTSLKVQSVCRVRQFFHICRCKEDYSVLFVYLSTVWVRKILWPQALGALL
jgi:hypothetical protein